MAKQNQENSIESQKEEIQNIKDKYDTKNTKYLKVALPILLVAAAANLASLVITKDTRDRLNLQYNNPVVIQYHDTSKKRSQIEKSIDYLQQEISRERLNENLPYQPNELRDSIEQVFVDSSKTNSLDRLAQQYQSHLEQTNAQLDSLRGTSEYQKYDNTNDLLMKGPMRLFSLLVAGVTGGILGLGAVQKRKIKKIKKRFSQ